MLDIIGSSQSTFSFCESPIQRLQLQDKGLCRNLGFNESEPADSPENHKKFLNYLKKTNRICSPLFATFIPVRPDCLSDVFLPISTHYVKKLSSSGVEGRIWNAIRTSGALLTDITSLPFRLITFLPRAISGMFRLPLIKLWHPIKYLAYVDDGENPCIISSDKEKFYFSLSPIHKSEAKEYFDTRIPDLFNTSLNPKEVIYFPGNKRDTVRISDLFNTSLNPKKVVNLPPEFICENPSEAIEFFIRINASLNPKKVIDSPPESIRKDPSLPKVLDRIRLAIPK